jgi:hypothetical protein
MREERSAIAEHAARRRGVVIPLSELGAQLAHLVRGGCTLAPDAYLFTVIDRAITAEQSKFEPTTGCACVATSAIVAAFRYILTKRATSIIRGPSEESFYQS